MTKKLKKESILVLAFLCMGCVQAQAFTDLSLQQAYETALKRSEAVAITAEDMAQAQARFYKAFDYFLPNVHYEITRFEQDVGKTDSSSALDFGRRIKPEQKFVFSQPLFSGFKEFAALSGTGADKKEQKMKWKRAKEMLFVDVMEAYYALVYSQKGLGVLSELHRLTEERIESLKERVELGRSRDSELKSSVADLKIMESDLIEGRKKVRVYKNLLEFYLGESIGDQRLLENNGEPYDFKAAAGASQKRSDVVGSEMAYIVAQKNVIAANAHFFPTISLDGNYYTRRVGFQEGNDWDVMVKFDVPVFEVGSTLGDIKEAASLREQARLAWEAKKRHALSEAKDSMDEYDSARDSEQALKEAEAAAKENYEILQKEFEQNLVNNLEVLDALRRYQDVEKRYHEAQFSFKKSYWNLLATLGEFPGVSAE